MSKLGTMNALVSVVVILVPFSSPSFPLDSPILTPGCCGCGGLTLKKRLRKLYAWTGQNSRHYLRVRTTGAQRSNSTAVAASAAAEAAPRMSLGPRVVVRGMSRNGKSSCRAAV